jgi:hypothetical protein
MCLDANAVRGRPPERREGDWLEEVAARAAGTVSVRV